jgi:hypothetical protein
MSQPTQAEWESIRHKWGNNPRLTFGEAGESYAVTKQAVAKMAKKEGWEKSASLSTINQRAHRKADNLSPVVGVVDVVVGATSADTQSAVDIRAAILATQREEIKTIPLLQNKAISLFDVAIQASAAAKNSDEASVKNREKTAWYIAKLASECVKTHAMIISMKQEAESKAWGLDMYEFEQRLIPNLNLLTIEELDKIVDTGQYPAYMTKGLRD